MAAFQQLVKLLGAVAGGKLLKIDGGGAVGDVGNAGACVSKHSTDRIAHIPKVTTFVPPRAGPTQLRCTDLRTVHPRRATPRTMTPQRERYEMPKT